MAQSTDPLVLQLQVEIANLDALVDQLQSQLSTLSSDFIKLINSKLKDDLKIPSDPNNTEETKQNKEGNEKLIKGISAVQGATDKMADAGISIVQGVFGLVEQIYDRLKKSAPLLEAVEQLFNLAWTLFFMPLGNKLGEVLIPAVIQMMDEVMEIWDAFEGMTLGEMFSYAIKEGVIMLSNFLINIGDLLKDEGGLVGSIGNMLSFMGEFIRDHGAQLLSAILNVASWVLDHLKEIIAAIIAFKVASIGLQLTMIAVQAAAGAFWSGGATIALAAAGTAISVGAGVATGIGVVNAFAEGGHVDATPGGQLAIVGEGGEGEWIIPDSKMDSFGGNTYNINIYSYSTDELADKVRSIVAGEVSASRLRSGF